MQKKEETRLIESKEDIINVGDKIRILLETKMFQDKLSPKYSNKI